MVLSHAHSQRAKDATQTNRTHQRIRCCASTPRVAASEQHTSLVPLLAGLLLAAGVILWATCTRHRRRQRQLGKASSCSKPQPLPSELGDAGNSRQLADGASPSSSCVERGDTEEG